MTSITSSILFYGNIIMTGSVLFYGASHSISSSSTAPTQKDGSADDFGYSVSAQNNIMVISSMNKTVSGITALGESYVYSLSGGVWNAIATLTLTSALDSIAGTASHFGWAVSISDNWIAIGAPGYKSASTGGAVFLYQCVGGVWSTSPSQTINYTDTHGYYGFSISLDQATGTSLAIGQPKGNGGSGLVEIWTLGGSLWNKQSTLTFSGSLRASSQSFGYSVSLNDNVLVTGGPGNLTGAGLGLAYISTYSSGNWSTPVILSPNDGSTNDGFGSAVCVRGSLVAISLPIVSSPYGGNVYLYDTSGNATGTLSVANAFNVSPTILDSNVTSAAKVGNSLDIDDSGQYIIAGAPGYLNGIEDSGAVYIFENNNGIWGPSTFNNSSVSRLDPAGLTNNQKMGNSVTFNHSGQFGILAGAPGTNLQGRFYWFD